MSRIVVGVDGSTRSQTALAWAADEAALRDATLHVVYVYEVPSTPSPDRLALAYAPASAIRQAAAQASESVQEQQAIARRRAESSISRMVRDLPSPPSGSVEQSAIPAGNIGRTLTNAARSADLLVVGSRGRGGVTGLLLGSVSQYCVLHAPCPVTVVPTTTT